MSAPRRLETRMVEKPWGRTALPAPFAAPPGKRIGEIWFEPPAELARVLVKFLFTDEKLSVQVHPAQAQALAGESGKEECWLVLDAQEGARLAIGLVEPVDAPRLRAAAIDGSIEGLLQWHPVAPGDFFYLPAGTVHAIGAGISLVEIQQNSDTTFRLYDYGRDRDLHLDRALAVAQRAPYDPRLKRRVGARSERLVDGPFFRLECVIGAPTAAQLADFHAGAIVVVLDGRVRARDQAFEGGQTFEAGSALYAADCAALDFSEARECLLVAEG